MGLGWDGRMDRKDELKDGWESGLIPSEYSLAAAVDSVAFIKATDGTAINSRPQCGLVSREAGIGSK